MNNDKKITTSLKLPKIEYMPISKTKSDYITPAERIETGRRNPNPADDYADFMGKLDRRRNPGPPATFGNRYTIGNKIIDSLILLYVVYLIASLIYHISK